MYILVYLHIFRLVHIIHSKAGAGGKWWHLQYCSQYWLCCSSVACMRRKQERVSGSRNESVKLLCEYELFLTVLTLLVRGGGWFTQYVFCGVLCGAAAVHTDRPPECCSLVKKTSTESWVRNIGRKMQCCWKERSDILGDRGHRIMLILKCWMGLALIINIKLHYITRELDIYSNYQLFFSRRRNVSSATFESSIIFILKSWIKSNLGLLEVSSILWYVTQVMWQVWSSTFHPSLGFEDVHCEGPDEAPP